MVTAAKTTTEEKGLWDKILEKSLSHNVYKELNSEVNGNNYDSCCKLFVTSDNNNDNESYKLCKKIARNTDYLYDISNTSEYSSRCSHYRHWVYENIVKIIKKTTQTDKISVVNKFIDVRNCIMHTYRVYNCLFDFKQNELPKLENKLEEKHLYDYFNNFDTIKIDETCNHVQINKYKQYLNDISEIYKKHNKENHCCNGSWQENCFSYFRCNNDFDPEKLLNKLNNVGIENCNKLEKEKKPTSSDISTTSQGEESDIMSTFYTGPCKNIGEGRLICSLRQASYISPKVLHKPPKYIPKEKNDQRRTDTHSNEENSDGEDSDEELSNDTVSSQVNNSTLHSINTGSMVSNLKTDATLKREPVQDRNPQPLNPVIPNIQNKPLQTVVIKEGFKWKFGDGTLSCSQKNSNEDKHNLCGYISDLKKTNNFIKNSYQGNAYLLNNMLSKAENINNMSPIEKTNQRDINMDSNSITHMFNNMYSPSNSVHEENILNSTYIRVSMVAALILGIVFLFFIYYKFTPLGFCLRRTFSKKKNIRSNVPSEILHPKSTKIPPKGNRKSPNRGYLVAYQSA